MAIDLNELATAMSQLILRFRMRRDTAAGWTSANPVLTLGEEGFETDTKKRKVGDGVSAWGVLPYDIGSAAPALPVPATPIFWGSTVHRSGIVGRPVYALDAPGFQSVIPLQAGGTGVLFGTHGADFITNSVKMAFSPIAPIDVLNTVTVIAAIRTPAAWSSGTPGTVVSAPAGSLQFRLNNNAGVIRLEIMNSQNATLLTDNAAGSLSLSTDYVVTMIFDKPNSTFSLRRNGTQTASAANIFNPPTGLQWVGGCSAAGEFANFAMSEILIYDRVLTSGELTTAETYMATRHY